MPCPSSSPPAGQEEDGKISPAASLWEPEIEKILILKSKCHRLGEDPKALKINTSMREAVCVRGCAGRGQSEGKEEMGQ